MKVAIIGAGASGLMAASNLNCETLLFDKNNEIGKKLKITGNSRANITNARVYDDFLENIIRNKKFFYSSFNNFSNFDTMDFFVNRNLDLLTEENLKVYPITNSSKDVINVFRKEISKDNIKLHLNEKVLDVRLDDRFVVETDKGIYTCDKVIVATGGLSFKYTGSTGFGYKIAKKFGHTIIDQKPSLTSIIINDRFNFKAISLKDVMIKAESNNKIFEEIGDILISDRFITGPCVLNLSSKINRLDKIDLSVDFFYKYDFKDLDNILISILNKNSNLNINNAFQSLLPMGIINEILKRSGIKKSIKANQLKAEDRHSIITTLKEFKLSFNRLNDTDKAIITSGGVDVKEINPSTMESKLVKGIYFIGEVLDLEGLTGGFNLQIAFSSAYSASCDIRRNG
ncbi:MAG: NAD(P)/FAD-dependent oxidoreductase [Tissierellia bacterium]|nr:NAD(P)/FAD-dependent oxidoreductase [Tissierellia bacterium]